MEIKEIIKKWKGNKRFTLKFVDEIDEEQLNYKPVEGMKTYLSQLSHITTWLRTHSWFVTEEEFEKGSLKTKQQVIIQLEELFDRLIDYLENATDEDLNTKVELWYGTVSKESVLLTMDNHLSHHRGQLVVYLRHLDIKVPSYIGW